MHFPVAGDEWSLIVPRRCDAFFRSRLASKIVLGPEMNGMTVRIMHSNMQNRN
jgi:hypothetical protein